MVITKLKSVSVLIIHLQPFVMKNKIILCFDPLPEINQEV